MSTRYVGTLVSVFCLLIGLTLWRQPLAVEPAAAGKEPWHLEQRYEGWIEVFGRQVPIPGGPWVLVGVGVDPVQLQPVRAYGVIVTLVLFKLSGPTVAAFALIHANAIPVNGGWGLSGDCQRTDLPFAKVYEDSEQHAFCAFIRSLKTSAEHTGEDLAAWQGAVELAGQRGWRLPSAWREVGFRICDWHDVLDVRYAFNPQTIEVLANPAGPAPPSEAGLLHWVNDMQSLIYLGFKRSLAGQPVPGMPGDRQPIAQEGAIDAVAVSKEMSNSELGLWKVVSSRVINISTSLGIDYLFVGSMYLAAGLQLVSSTFHGGVDYLEELLWNTYGPQRLHRASTCDFTYVGDIDH